jgi:outer membrane protein assembly factor BamA
MGFLEAKIEFSYTKLPGNFIDLDFILSEGPRLMIDSLRVAGNIKIKEHKIIEAFPFKKDQWIYYNMLLRGQRKLYETGAFSSVSLLLEPSETDPLKRVVVINIKEKKVGIIEGGIGYGTKDGGRVSTGIAHGNISGNASKISSRIGMSRISLNNGFYQFEKNADIAYSNPWILNTMFKGNIGTGVVFLQDTMEYSIEAGLGRSLGDFNDLSFAYRYEYTVREHVASSNNGALLLTFTRDSRDDFFETRHGNFSSFETEYGTPLLGEYHYLKETIETRRYISPSPYKTFAVRLRAGIVTSLLDTLRLPPNTLFFEGGDQSVRGYGYHALNTNAASQGSASSGVSSIEFRQRTGKELLFFNDLGFVFFLDGAILSTYDYKNYSGSFLGAGFGLRASFALGVLRFDLALPLQKPLVKQQGAFYFAFGQSF